MKRKKLTVWIMKNSKRWVACFVTNPRKSKRPTHAWEAVNVLKEKKAQLALAAALGLKPGQKIKVTIEPIGGPS